jgi:UDP-glucose 4-epimerase
MKILITGASGFLGSWIVRELSDNFEVHAVIRLDSDAYRIQTISGIEVKRLTHEDLLRYIRDWRPEAIIATDWWGVGSEFRNDQRQFENISRQIDIANSSVQNDVKVFIGVGSQAELGPISGTIRETAIDNPTTLYGSAKCQSRMRLEEIFYQTNCRFVWMRVFSTYGAMDQGTWFIPDLIQTLSSGKIMNMTLGAQVWSYLHAFDAAKAFRVALENPDISGIVNLGNESNTTIRDVALEVQNILGLDNLISFGSIPYRKDQVMSLMPDCEKLRRKNWRPLVNLSEGLNHTIRWTQGLKSISLPLNTGEIVSISLPSRN